MTHSAHRQIKAEWTALSRACGKRLEGMPMHGARGGGPEGERNGNYRHGARTKEAIELTKFIRKLGTR
jgi:hypothetical protein